MTISFPCMDPYRRYADYLWDVEFHVSCNPGHGRRSVYTAECREYMQDNGFHDEDGIVSVSRHISSENETVITYYNRHITTLNLNGKSYDWRIKAYAQLCDYYRDEMTDTR